VDKDGKPEDNAPLCSELAMKIRSVVGLVKEKNLCKGQTASKEGKYEVGRWGWRCRVT